MRRFLIALLGLVVAAACAPTYHRAAPYRFDRVAAERLALRASEVCHDRGEPAGTPTYP